MQFILAETKNGHGFPHRAQLWHSVPELVNATHEANPRNDEVRNVRTLGDVCRFNGQRCASHFKAYGKRDAREFVGAYSPDAVTDAMIRAGWLEKVELGENDEYNVRLPA